MLCHSQMCGNSSYKGVRGNSLPPGLPIVWLSGAGTYHLSLHTLPTCNNSGVGEAVSLGWWLVHGCTP